jgi:NTF2 fold immunity protein of polymorphic toxin system component
MKYWAIPLCALLSLSAFGQGYKPKSGYVPDAKTAVKIAEAVLIPVYGEKKIESERPFTAALNNEVWTATGTFRCPDGREGAAAMGCRGGVASVRIAKDDARILSMEHGR